MREKSCRSGQRFKPTPNLHSGGVEKETCLLFATAAHFLMPPKKKKKKVKKKM